MASFNLISEPWIPCRNVDGQMEERSLRDALTRAHELRELWDPSPLVTVTLHRLLLAVLHRCFGPANKEAWRALWQAGRFDTGGLDSYFREYRDRFGLFHPERPFYQVTRMYKVRSASAEVKRHPVLTLAEEAAS